MLKEIFKKHNRVVLFYSGGKDSLALLLLLRPFWDKVDVVWVDTGNQFPEVLEHMEKVKGLVPRFTTLRGHLPGYFIQNGFPVDVVPENCTSFGQACFGEQPIKCVSRFQCCSVNMWEPMIEYVRATKPTCALRADRKTERLKGPSSLEGAEMVFPLWDWTDEQVWKYLQKNAGDLLEERHCMAYRTSLDCQICMGYFRGTSERLDYLKKHHPELHKKTVRFFKAYKAVVADEMKKIKE